MIIYDVIDSFSRFLRHGNDDSVDRFHYLYTVIGLCVYLLFINGNVYLGAPLVCMQGMQNDDFNKYAHSM